MQPHTGPRVLCCAYSLSLWLKSGFELEQDVVACQKWLNLPLSPNMLVDVTWLTTVASASSFKTLAGVLAYWTVWRGEGYSQLDQICTTAGKEE